MAEDGTGYTMIVSYGPDNERWESQLSHGDTLKRTIRYFGDYEEIVENGTTRKLYYLDDNVLYVKQTGQADKIYFLMTDHLGSVVKILDESRTTKFAATYDAWGNQTVTQNDIGFHRGYTGHEMLPEFGLINMNGRLYDPVIGRFLSTDNYVQQPANSQNFNRYSYCLNNPLKFTDSDGESFSLLFGIVISSMLNWYSNGCETNMKGFVHAAIGAGIGVASFYSGQFISTSLSAIGILPGATVGAIAGSAIGSISSIMSNGLNNIVNGSSFTSNMASNALSGAISGAVSGAISGGIKGFKNAKKVDANVWTGNKIIKEQTIATSIKDILPQEDASKWCYAVAGEYADLGHGNRNRDDFLCVSDYADGFDFQKAAKKVGMDVISYSKLSAKEYKQLEYYFKTKKYEVVLSIGKDVNNGHAVNLVSYDIQTKLNVLGGGVHQIVRNMKVWDPLFGKVTDLNDNILKVQIVRY